MSTLSKWRRKESSNTTYHRLRFEEREMKETNRFPLRASEFYLLLNFEVFSRELDFQKPNYYPTQFAHRHTYPFRRTNSCVFDWSPRRWLWVRSVTWVCIVAWVSVWMNKWVTRDWKCECNFESIKEMIRIKQIRTSTSTDLETSFSLDSRKKVRLAIRTSSSESFVSTIWIVSEIKTMKEALWQ